MIIVIRDLNKNINPMVPHAANRAILVSEIPDIPQNDMGNHSVPCIYKYICRYIYIYVYVYVYVGVYTSIYVCLSMYMYMCLCISHLYIPISIYVYLYLYT